MVTLPFIKTDWKRSVPQEAQLLIKNRYFEDNPVLSEDGAALIARPGMKKYLSVGAGPIRGIYSTPGSFDEALFVVSGSEWYRIDVDNTVTLLQTGITGGTNSVSMAGTGDINDVPAFMFLADGTSLWVYTDNGFATATLTGTATAATLININGVYYDFTNAGVDVGTPAGTGANPWLVALGGTPADSLYNLYLAINDGGGSGVNYSSALEANPYVLGRSYSTTNLVLQAKQPGTIGNTYSATSSGGIVVDHSPLSGGGSPGVFKSPMPDDVGAISVGYVSSNVVVIPAQGKGVNGRFYWILPGEVIVDPLNFATAERSPDPVSGVVVFGDQFWLPGPVTTEVWYFTGNPDTPAQRLQGITFDRGSWGGTAQQVKDSMIITDNDGGVFQIKGGDQRISNPSIEQRIRKAIEESS